MSAVKKQLEEREFDFRPEDFARVRALIYQRAGIALSEAKADMVYSRIGRRLRTVGMNTFRDYLDFLEQENDADEWEAFTNSLTTNLTSFFREEHHFPILAEHIVHLKKPIRIWCSAASTGEEPYTIAMTACEAFNTLKPPVEIIATDIDTNVLATAARGVYPMDRVSKLSLERKKRFLLKGTGKSAGTVKVRKELQQLITFQPLNLLAESYPLHEQFDAIFCRNVMIYFDKPTQSKILEKFVPLMKPHALLFAGHSENFLYVSNAFKLRGKTVYELDHMQSRAKVSAARSVEARHV